MWILPENVERLFFALRKNFEKEKSNIDFFSKKYSLRFIDSARFMNVSLDPPAIFRQSLRQKAWILHEM